MLFFQTASDARECKFILIDRKLSFECPQQGILYFPWTAARCTLLSTTSDFTICRSLRHFLGHEFLLPPVQCLPFSTFFFFLKLTDISNHFFFISLGGSKTWDSTHYIFFELHRPIWDFFLVYPDRNDTRNVPQIPNNFPLILKVHSINIAHD